MNTLVMRLTLAIFLLIPMYYVQAADPAPRVRIATSFGDMIVELDNIRAPRTVENFLRYVRESAYDGTIFHRVIGDFMIQGGAYTASYEARPVHAAIQSEANNGLQNKRGTIAMAREYDPHTATNQFFINVEDNNFLNHHKPEPGYWGYTVFGKVTEGMDVLDRIRAVPTGVGGPFSKDVPLTQVLIKKISIEPPAPTTTLASADASPSPVKAAADQKKTAKKSTKKKTNKDAKAKDPGVKQDDKVAAQ